MASYSGVVYQEPEGIDDGQTASSPRKGGSNTASSFDPGSDPSRKNTAELPIGPSILNGASRFNIDNLNSTIIGTNNIHGQPERNNLWATAEGVFYDMINKQKNELSLKEKDLEQREARLQEQERLFAEQRRSMEELMVEQRRAIEEQERSLDERRQALESQRKTVDEQERILVQLAQRLRKLEEDLRTEEQPKKPGEISRRVHSARGGVGRYLTPRLRATFGDSAVGMEELAHQFDFTTIDIAERDSRPSFDVSLAPHYGGLNKEQVHGFPESLRVAIQSVVGKIEEARRADIHLTWPVLDELLMTHEYLKASAGTAKRFKEGPIWLKENLKSADLTELNEWLQKLFTDGDFPGANSTLYRVTRKSSQELPASTYDVKVLMDLLVLWFPVEDRRCFRLTQTVLKLCTTPRQGSKFMGSIGKSKTRHFLLVEHQTSCSFHPRESIIWKMGKEERADMAREAESLIDD